MNPRMNIDIVERLRFEADDTRSEERERLLREAADLIERLRAYVRNAELENLQSTRK
jgi:hypothetical protein